MDDVINDKLALRSIFCSYASSHRGNPRFVIDQSRLSGEGVAICAAIPPAPTISGYDLMEKVSIASATIFETFAAHGVSIGESISAAESAGPLGGYIIRKYVDRLSKSGTGDANKLFLRLQL